MTKRVRGRTNERPGTDHVISGPMRGLGKTAPDGANRQTGDGHGDSGHIFLEVSSSPYFPGNVLQPSSWSLALYQAQARRQLVNKTTWPAAFWGLERCNSGCLWRDGTDHCIHWLLYCSSYHTVAAIQWLLYCSSCYNTVDGEMALLRLPYFSSCHTVAAIL